MTKFIKLSNRWINIDLVADAMWAIKDQPGFDDLLSIVMADGATVIKLTGKDATTMADALGIWEVQA